MSSTQTPAAFNPNEMLGKIKEKIKGTFVDLIPEEAGEELVQKEIHKFFEEPSTSFKFVKKKEANGGYYSSGSHFVLEFEEEKRMSPFQQLVWHFCFEKALDVISSKVNAEYLTTFWNPDTNSQEFNDKMKELLKEIGSIAVGRFFSGMMMNSEQMMRTMFINFRNNGTF